MAITKINLVNQETRYRLYFSQLAYDKMRLYVDLCPDEIGWLGYVDKLENNLGYFVSDVFLVEQEVHATTTELSPEGILKYYTALSPEMQETFVNKCKLWGHSHVNMATGPSGQDIEQGLELSKDTEDFYIRLITNRRNEYNILFYDKTIGAEVTVDEVVIYNPEASKLRESIQNEIGEKVKKKVSKPLAIPSATTTKTTYSYSTSRTVKERSKVIPKIDIRDLLKKEDGYKSTWLQTLLEV